MSKIKNDFCELLHDLQDVTVTMFSEDTSLVCLAKTEEGLLELNKRSLNIVSTWMHVNKTTSSPH